MFVCKVYATENVYKLTLKGLVTTLQYVGWFCVHVCVFGCLHLNFFFPHCFDLFPLSFLILFTFFNGLFLNTTIKTFKYLAPDIFWDLYNV